METKGSEEEANEWIIMRKNLDRVIRIKDLVLIIIDYIPACRIIQKTTFLPKIIPTDWYICRDLERQDKEMAKK